MNKILKHPADRNSTQAIDRDSDLEVGQWFWVKQFKQDWLDDDEGLGPAYETDPWLACVVHIGSNFAEFRGPGDNHQRVHFDEFNDLCVREIAPEPVIASKIAQHGDQANKLMDRVKQLTARLGIAPRAELADESDTTSTALAVAHGTADIAEHKNALIKAKEETLPDLFKKIEEEHAEMAMWMKASLIPMAAEGSRLRKRCDAIDDRIFTVELYAGLTEELTQIKKGKPADNDEKIRIFQRRHYMDEECLAEYEAGGMSYKSLKSFDRWLTRKGNLDRILPHPRCVVAFRIRRERKNREDMTLFNFISIMNEEEYDKQTFLYIRNGSQVFRLVTNIDFGEELFPDTDHSSILGGGNLYMDIFAGRVGKIIGEQEYQGIMERHKEHLEEHWRKMEEWKNLSDKQRENRCEPWLPTPSSRLEMVEPNHIYYDDAMKLVAADAKAHNRVAVVLQGLLDRSPAFIPHPPWRLWEADGFTNGIELIHDNSRAITDGDAPDFEAYRNRLNASIAKGTNIVGQQDLWERYEANKDYERQRDDYRVRTPYRQSHISIYGNPGPGLIAQATKVGRDRQVHFEWQRERTNARWVSDPDNPGYQKIDDSTLTARFKCSANGVLNVDAYTPGDFRIFYNDPRTRKNYLKWAPLLLAAEDWHASKK